MARVHNFSAGPSTLPVSVLQRAANEMLDYKGSGQSVLEMSHRSKVFQGILDNTRDLVREVMHVPDNYQILFVQGGGSTQFAMVPLNFLTKSGKADYIVTGKWADNAYKEACKYGDIKLVASSKDKMYSYIPHVDKSMFTPDADYLHICQNNTIYGTRFTELPDCGDIPLVADLSSCILSEPIDVSKYACIYAGAQKNMGPSGIYQNIQRFLLFQLTVNVTACFLVLCGAFMGTESPLIFNVIPKDSRPSLLDRNHCRPVSD